MGIKGGPGVKRKIGKLPKGMFSAAGKHPMAAMREKIPSCEFAEVGTVVLLVTYIAWLKTNCYLITRYW